MTGAIYARLAELPADEEFESASVAVVETLEREDAGLDEVAQIIAFMADHPEIDFGPPGPLSHFIERFHRRGYEELLVASVEQRPTEHTLWLLQRLINGEPDGPVREHWRALYARPEAKR